MRRNSATQLNWTAAASQQTPWLSVSPASGQSTSSVSPAVTVQVSPTGLAAGTYYAQIQVSASGVANSPQIVTVVLSVASAAQPTDPDVRPTGLIFVARQGGANPSAQTVQLTNPNSTPVTYSTGYSYSQGTSWLNTAPPSGTVTPGTPALPAVSVSTSGMAPGIYAAQLSISFTETQTSHRIAILLLILPNPSSAFRGAAACTPTKLLPVFTLLGQNFITAAAWPASIEVTVVDDCGTPMTSGSVVTSFSSGDEPISLASMRDGRWSGTWTPHNTTTSPVVITAMAQTAAPVLQGTAMVGGSSRANPSVPIVQSGGVVSAASYAGSVPLSPGSMMSIFGSALAPALTVAQNLPLQTSLSGTQVLLAGKPVPLLFTSDGQINALVPYDIATNTSQQLLVVRGGAYSVPQPVTFADGSPAVFTTDQSGKGPGIVVGVRPDGTQYLNNPTNPSAAGEALVIYCAGLGSVDQPVAAGVASPSSPLANTRNPVTVTIAGMPANVFFAGLAPDFAGLYQVNAIMPTGLTPSSAAPLVITVAGQSSPPTTIAVR
jgi:uncharacterized protein (TIGR03437 family)